MKTIDEILSNPSEAYESPEAVLVDERLTITEMRAVLEQWRRDAQQLAIAAEESMAGGEPNLLHAVAVSLAKLDDVEAALD